MLLCFFILPGFVEVVLQPCFEALGMHSGIISDSSITASSSYNAILEPKFGRLYYLNWGSGTHACWRPAVNDKNQWLQADMGTWARVTGVATQGWEIGDQWVTSYSLSASNGVFYEFVKTKSGDKKVNIFNIIRFPSNTIVCCEVALV